MDLQLNMESSIIFRVKIAYLILNLEVTFTHRFTTQKHNYSLS